jgi:uncharacterized repeat protein (TIGR01451 family)
MSFVSVWRKRFARPRTVRRSGQSCRPRLRLEILEDRNLPAPVTPSAGVGNGAAAGNLVEVRQSTTPITNIDDAQALLAPGAPNVKFTAFDDPAQATVINYADTVVNNAPPLSGDFGNDRDIRKIPGNGFGTGPQENYVIHASGFIQIPTAGAWTFTVNSDDGFLLTMGASNTMIAGFPDEKTPSNISGVADVPQPGMYHYDLVYFQAVASPDTSSEVEFSASGPGQATNMLVGTGALQVFQGLTGLTLSASGPATAVAGDNLAYAITLANNGSKAAQNAKLTVPVPANTTFVSASQAPDSPLTIQAPSAGGTGTIQASSPSFAAGTSVTLTLVVRVSPAVTTGTGISMTATATSDGTTDVRTATVATMVVAATGATTPNGHYVIQLYRDLLEMPLYPTQDNQFIRSEVGIAQDPGVQDRINALDSGKMTRSQVVFSVINGTEYRTRVIDALYFRDLGRSVAGDDLGLNTWLAFFNRGGSIRGVEAAILSSPEFFIRNGSTSIGFLQGAYRNATGQEIPANLLAAYLDTLSNGFTHLVVTRQIVITPAANDHTVTRLYAQFLRRLADAGGRTAFDNALQAGASDEQVLVAITSSDEYFKFAQTQTGFQP